MADSRDLYQLIGSLGRAEKRYCRVMLQAGLGRKATSCLRLFEILSGMRTHDERAVRAAVAEESFARHLAVTKNHLYEHLLRTLRMYDAVESRRGNVRAAIESAEVLKRRGLYAAARERLGRARASAEAGELMPERLEIAYLEWDLDRCEGYAGVAHEDLAERRARVEETTAAVRNYWDHLGVYAGASLELLLHGPRTHDASERLEEVVGGPLAALPPPATARARNFHREALRTYHLLTGRYDRGYAHSAESLALVESYPMDVRLDRLNYLGRLHYHTVLSIRVGRYAEARRTAAKLDSLHISNQALLARRARLAFSCRLDVLMIDFDHEGIAALAADLEEIRREEEDAFTRQLCLGHAVILAAAQYINGLLNEAARTLHPVINDNRPGFRNDVLCTARLLQLMIHYDRGDIELLPYMIRSTYRFMARYGGITEVDRAILRSMRRLANLVTRDDLLHEFARLRDELAAIGEDAPESSTSVVRDVLPWLESKITGRSYRDLMIEARDAMEIGDTEEAEPARAAGRA